MNEKLIKRLIVSGVLFFVVLILGINSCSVVGSTERGIKKTFGNPSQEVLGPGLHLKVPFAQSIEKYDLTPIEYEKSFSVGQDGAVSKDLQTVGVTFTLYWKYDETRIPDVVRNYKTKDSIYQPISTAVKAAIKSEIGKYSIEEIIANQNVITNNVRDTFMKQIEYLPIMVTDFKIGNYDWDDTYDAMIKETMNRKQQVEQMKQEVALSEQAAQKQVKEAEAEKQRIELESEAALVKAQKEAEAEIAKAKGEAEAKKVEADALAYYNTKVAQNLNVEIKMKELEIEKIRAEKWNGVEVSSQSVYVPNTYDLKSR